MDISANTGLLQWVQLRSHLHLNWTPLSPVTIAYNSVISHLKEDITMEVASFRASQFYEIASFGIGSNCKILSLLLEGHYRHYPLLKLRCIYSVRFYTIDLKYVQCNCTCQLQSYRCTCITD